MKPAKPPEFWGSGKICLIYKRLIVYIFFMKNLARLFKALGDETRLKILWLLLNKEELCVCDIMRVLGITQSKASRHLRYLYHVGLVSDRREGVWMNYRLRQPREAAPEEWLRLLKERLNATPEAQALKEQLATWLQAKVAKEPRAGLC